MLKKEKRVRIIPIGKFHFSRGHLRRPFSKAKIKIAGTKIEIAYHIHTEKHLHRRIGETRYKTDVFVKRRARTHKKIQNFGVFLYFYCKA